MGKDTAIAWCHHTFNPWWGCQRVSPGCEHCYAESFAKRVGQKVWGPGSERRFFGDAHWAEPLKWNAAAERAGVRRRVFCASMADVFEDRPDLHDQRARLWRLIQDTSELDWLLLTKRPENLSNMLPWRWPDQWANVWLGCTAEDQRRLDERIFALVNAPAVIHFISHEPALGPIVIPNGIDWVITGGESGHSARPFNLDWARLVRDQCAAAGVAFFFKQAGSNPDDGGPLKLRDRKGGDLAELGDWPRDFPR